MLNSTATIYRMQKNYEDALKNFKEAIRIFEQMKDQQSVSLLHTQAMHKTIKFCAIRLSSKPIEVDELRLAVEKVINKKAKETFQSKFDMLLCNQSQINHKITK